MNTEAELINAVIFLLMFPSVLSSTMMVLRFNPWLNITTNAQIRALDQLGVHVRHRAKNVWKFVHKTCYFASNYRYYLLWIQYHLYTSFLFILFMATAFAYTCKKFLTQVIFLETASIAVFNYDFVSMQQSFRVFSQ